MAITASSTPPSQTIIKHQQQVQQHLPFADTQDFDATSNGLIAPLDPNPITDERGNVVWNSEAYNFIQGDAPTSANPSLWRQSTLNCKGGLFLVTEGIYQVRGLDLSNTTFVEGNEGIIVIDTLTCKETAKAALDLYRSKRGNRPIKAVIYTHSHVDHFGGVGGMITQNEVDTGKVKLLAPEGFLEHAISENVYAGTAMSRRAGYMYAAAVPKGPKGQIGSGLGQTTSTGTITLIAPNDTIRRTGETRKIDGVDIVFQMAPGTEAPSEMLLYFPQRKALCAAEDATHTFHNVLTLRGAEVRDPRAWSHYLTETINLFGQRTDVVFASHHWPTWGRENILSFLTTQRDMFAYLHDQTLRMINLGLTSTEIAEQLVIPPALEQTWSSRGYYGSVSHNAKAVYQRYIGWFDGNPAKLWERPPVETAKRYVNLAGGVKQIIQNGRTAYEQGDYRWAAEVLNHAVFADPNSTEARNLLSETYEQLGYGAENGTWRNFYLSGAYELREGNFGTPTKPSPDIISQLEPEMVFDCLAITVNGPRAWNTNFSMQVVLTDQPPIRYLVWLSNGALVYHKTEDPVTAEVTLTATRKALPSLVLFNLNPAKIQAAGVSIDGNPSALTTLAGLLEQGNPSFNIVTPRALTV
ncbi:Metallo-hydrolase/oxidoreductase [Thozetella sp. PMI_491]|nr:Metallo-hydrolase/oxidoreductase [Thozetella sp. PMI_491]